VLKRCGIPAGHFASLLTHPPAGVRRQNTMPSVARGCKGTLRRLLRYAAQPPLHPCSLRAPYFSCRRPSRRGVRLGAVPAVPAGRSRRPFRRSCGGVGGGSGFVLFVQCWGVCHGWFCFCLVFSRCGRGRPAAVLRLGVGSPRVALRGGLVAGAGLPVRAVRFVRPGGRLRARRFGAGVAGVGPSRLRRLCGLVRLRPAGPGFRGQGGLAFRPFLPRRLRGLAANARALFAGGSRCLGCLAW
jgi:hypothetical protein